MCITLEKIEMNNNLTDFKGGYRITLNAVERFFGVTEACIVSLIENECAIHKSESVNISLNRFINEFNMGRRGIVSSLNKLIGYGIISEVKQNRKLSSYKLNEEEIKKSCEIIFSLNYDGIEKLRKISTDNSGNFTPVSCVEKEKLDEILNDKSMRYWAKNSPNSNDSCQKAPMSTHSLQKAPISESNDGDSNYSCFLAPIITDSCFLAPKSDDSNYSLQKAPIIKDSCQKAPIIDTIEEYSCFLARIIEDENDIRAFLNENFSDCVGILESEDITPENKVEKLKNIILSPEFQKLFVLFSTKTQIIRAFLTYSNNINNKKTQTSEASNNKGENKKDEKDKEGFDKLSDFNKNNFLEDKNFDRENFKEEDKDKLPALKDKNIFDDQDEDKENLEEDKILDGEVEEDFSGLKNNFSSDSITDEYRIKQDKIISLIKEGKPKKFNLLPASTFSSFMNHAENLRNGYDKFLREVFKELQVLNRNDEGSPAYKEKQRYPIYDFFLLAMNIIDDNENLGIEYKDIPDIFDFEIETAEDGSKNFIIDTDRLRDITSPLRKKKKTTKAESRKARATFYNLLEKLGEEDTSHLSNMELAIYLFHKKYKACGRETIKLYEYQKDLKEISEDAGVTEEELNSMLDMTRQAERIFLRDYHIEPDQVFAYNKKYGDKSEIEGKLSQVLASESDTNVSKD